MVKVNSRCLNSDGTFCPSLFFVDKLSALPITLEFKISEDRSEDLYEILNEFFKKYDMVTNQEYINGKWTFSRIIIINDDRNNTFVVDYNKKQSLITYYGLENNPIIELFYKVVDVFYENKN